MSMSMTMTKTISQCFAPGLLAAFLASTAIAAAPPARTAAPAPTAPQTPNVPDYEVVGFRDAKWGMSEAQVRAAMAQDFPAAGKITEITNPLEGTKALQITVPSLPPGPGTATVTYILGATSKTLSHVNVVWSEDGDPTKEQRELLITAAVQLTRYFQSLPSAPRATAQTTPTGPNSLLMYAAVDKKGAGVEIDAEGIGYQTSAQTPGKTAADAPAPKGPALLRMSYMANVLNPDVYKVKPGAF